MSTTTQEKIKQRRETKFAKHDIFIKDDYYIYHKGKLVGQAHSKRSALKHAHQVCRNLESGKPVISQRRAKADYKREASISAEMAEAMTLESTKKPTRRGKRSK